MTDNASIDSIIALSGRLERSHFHCRQGDGETVANERDLNDGNASARGKSQLR